MPIHRCDYPRRLPLSSHWYAVRPHHRHHGSLRTLRSRRCLRRCLLLVSRSYLLLVSSHLLLVSSHLLLLLLLLLLVLLLLLLLLINKLLLVLLLVRWQWATANETL